MFGILCLLPELSNQLPLASRSLKSWRKLATSSEGGPLTEEAVLLIAVCLIVNGMLMEGFWVLAQYDSYGREQDMEGLQVDDAAWDGRRLALLFGVSARGESVKTGSNQGIVVRRGVVADIIRGLCAYWKRGHIFRVSQQQLRKSWHWACRRLGIAFTGPPHSLRHTGPSEDIARLRTSLEGARRRGRWRRRVGGR